MKSIKRGQRLIAFILVAFIIGMIVLVVRIQRESAFYMSHNTHKVIGNVYDKNGDVLFDGSGDFSKYEDKHFIDVGNLIGDNTGQMSNTLVAKNLEKLNNYSFSTGLVENGGKSAIYTSLDHYANKAVYNAFENKKGCAVAYDYITGEILVCVSLPSVDIAKGYANIAEFETGTLISKNLYGTVPGSTQKIPTLIAALETIGEEKLLDKTYNCTGAYVNMNGQTIKCHKSEGHGEQNITKAFANSCNPFYAQLVEDSELPLDSIKKSFNSLGYSINGEKKNYISIDGINCETASTTLENSSDFDTQWGCIGQGDTLVSPVQMILWNSAVANETGRMTMPYLIDHITNVKGKITDRAETKYSDSIFDANTAEAAKKIMLENGKNYTESISGYELGIKSGTAQVKNGEEENSLLTGFVNDRRHPIAFCVLIEDKKSGNVKTEQIVKCMLDSLCS